MSGSAVVDVADFGLSLLTEDELIAQFHRARIFTDEEIIERRPPRQWDYLKDGLVENVKNRVIRVDGVIQREVRAYDMDAGWIRKLQRHPNGTFLGMVEIE